MNDDIFDHGDAGEWDYSISEIRAGDSTVSVSADIRCRGKHRCKLVISQASSDREALVELMRTKCIAWIEDAAMPDQRFPRQTAAERRRQSSADAR